MNTQVEPALDDAIEISLAEASLSLAKKRQKWNAIKGFYRPIVNALQRLGVEPGLSNEVDVNFTGDALRLQSVLRILTESGFTTTAESPKKGDTSWSAYFAHPDCETKVWLYFTSSVCRRVKVGTKTVEQDVFEIVCGDCTVESMQLEAPAPVLDTAALEAVF